MLSAMRWWLCVSVLGVMGPASRALAAAPSPAELLATAAKRYQSHIRDAKVQYLADLKACFRAAMGKGDIDEAKRIEAARRQVEEELAQDIWRDLPNVPDDVRASAERGGPDTEEGVAPDTFLARRALGDWVLENDAGVMVAAMRMEAIGEGLTELTRVGGGPLAVCGTYALQGRKLVKEKRPGDAYWDLTWHSVSGKWTLRRGQYAGWTLKRPER